MNKKIFSIYFIVALFSLSAVRAEVIAIDQFDNRAVQQLNTTPLPDIKMPDPNNQEAVRAFFKKRFEEAARSVFDKDIDMESPVSVGVVHTPEYYEQQKEKEKPLFQKIYERTIASLQGDNEDANDNQAQDDPLEREVAAVATRFYTLAEPQKADKRRAKFPTVSVALPSGRRILAPAREHVAYFLSYIDIQANGYLKIEDTVTVVANNKRLAYGLPRIFAKNTEKYKKIDFILESVTINDQKVPYMVEEVGDNIVLTPKYNHKLESGVYTYKFNYIINNRLQQKGNRWLLDWSITGRPLNMFVTSANVIISVPTGHSFDDIAAVVGHNGRYTNIRTNRFDLAGNVVAFSNRTPLFQGEDMHVVAVMDKNVFFKNFNKNFANLIGNWGNIIYSVLGLSAILISFILSFINLKHDQKSNKYTPSYNGYLMRSIAVGKYDRLAFVAQLLDLYRKNALDLTQDNGRVFIEAKEVDNARLNTVEKRGLKQLFGKKKNVIEVNNANTMFFKRAKNIFEKSVIKQIKKYRLIHNISYVLFSTAMLLITEISIALISINFAQTLIILLATTLMYAFYIWILRHRFKKWYISMPIKVLTLCALFAVWVFSSVYVGGTCSFLIVMMVMVIFAFTRIFAEHNNFVNEAKDAIGKYKEYLISSADAINLGRGFINQQSNVFALGLDEYYPRNVTNQNYYRLDIADILKQLLIGII